MKILSLSTDENILKEGSEVRERMRWYGELVEELHIIALTQNLRLKTQKFGNVFIYPANSRSKIFRLFNAYCIGKTIIKSSVIGHKLLVTSQDPFETGLVGFLLKRKFKIPLQIQIHTDFLSPYFWRESLKNKIRVLLAKFLIPKADGIRVVSERVKKSLSASPPNWRTSWRAKISVLPIFVDVEKIKNVPIRTDLHKKYPEYDFIILMASRLTREKNIGLAIEAMKEIAKRHPKTLLLIVGSGPRETDLRQMTNDLRLTDNVKFEKWTDDIISYYKTADLFLLTSNYEGYGRSIIEAIISGLSIITTDVGVADRLRQISIIPIGKVGGLVNTIKEKISRKETLRSEAPEGLNYKSKEEYLDECKKSWEQCFCKEIKVCYFGSYDSGYSRNVVIRKGLSKNGVRVIECNALKKGRARFKYLELFQRFFKECRDCDAIVVPEFCQAFMPLAFLTSKLSGKPLIFDSFVSFYDSAVFDREVTKKFSLKALYYYFFDWLSVRLADSLLVDTFEHGEYFKKVFGANPAKINVIHIGADDEVFRPDSNLPRSEPGYGRKFKVLFYGTYIPLHGIQYIIKAAKEIENRDVDIEFTIVGKGQTYNQIQKLYQDLNPQNVRFLKFLPWDELVKLIRSSDLCLGIFGDTDKAKRVIPNKVYECLAAGKPVITGDSSATRRIFEHKKHLFLCKMADFQSLVQAIMALKSDAKLRDSIAQNGHQFFKSNFTPSELGKKVKIVIEKSLK